MELSIAFVIDTQLCRSMLEGSRFCYQQFTVVIRGSEYRMQLGPLWQFGCFLGMGIPQVSDEDFSLIVL